MSDVTDVVVAVSSFITAGGIGFLAWQTSMQRRQTGAMLEQTKAMAKQNELAERQVKMLVDQVTGDHERSRRTMAVELLRAWSLGLSKEASSARKIAESLDKENALKMSKYETFTVPIAERVYVKNCLTEKEFSDNVDTNHSHLTIIDSASIEIRWRIVQYLNSLESILSAVRHGVADAEMISEQFGYLVDQREGGTGLQMVREAFMEDSFPAITYYVTEARKQKPMTPGKTPIFKPPNAPD